jgi:alkylation response protein AidB-like acyl-CoA dehydrogenase
LRPRCAVAVTSIFNYQSSINKNMADKYCNPRNVKFLLHEVFNVTSLNKYEHYEAYDEEAINMAMDAAKQIGDRILFPIVSEMDKEKAYFDGKEVQVHPQLRTAIQAIGAGGWIGCADDYEHEGQQMPLMVMNTALFLFYAANPNAAPYAFLTQGAANLIRAFATEELQQAYVPKMYSGEWQGTMAMTEPQAGSSLSDIRASATPTTEGHYKIKGQKIYISGGDHTAVDNVVHLFLARIDGAPAGTKGISLFIVPKLRTEDNQLVFNDVNTAGIFGKMGQKGYIAATLMYGEADDCHGYLVGSENRGLSYMFQMMNEARIGTGMLATGTATAAYYAALQYANERSQGRHPSNKDIKSPPVTIIEHADVRRMLLFQKSVVEGSLSLLIACSKYADIARHGEELEKEKAEQLLSLLTPIAKTFPSEYGTQAVSAAMQTMGGAGYCDDFPVEQYYRDIRVNCIYEGTTGIQGMDLLGRKVMMNDGKAMRHLLTEIHKTMGAANQIESLVPTANLLGEATKALHECTLAQVTSAMNEKPEIFLADATLYLEYFSLVVIAWQWLKQGIVAQEALTSNKNATDHDFYQGKLFTMRYFFKYELVKTKGLHTRLMEEDHLTLEVKAEYID